MQTVFDITEYGAVGDGATDCTEAIRACLADAEKARGTVVVPPGNYLTGKQRIGRGVSLEGHSAWSFREYGSSVFTLNSDDDCLLDITGGFGCSIRGMSLNGAGRGANIHGVFLHWPVYNGGGQEDTPTIDDCRIGNFSGDGVRLEHIWCFSVRHCMLCFNGGAGLYVDGWDGFVLDNWFSGNHRGGMSGGGACSSITATGNRVEWNRVAGFLLPHSNCCNFTGNYFDRSFGPALLLGDEKGEAVSLSITGNLIYRSGKPGAEPFADPHLNAHIRLIRGDNVNISGNTFRVGRDDGGKGVWSPDYVAVVSDSRNSILSGNAWSGGSLKDGFVLTGTNDGLSVERNVGCTSDVK